MRLSVSGRLQMVAVTADALLRSMRWSIRSRRLLGLDLMSTSLTFLPAGVRLAAVFTRVPLLAWGNYKQERFHGGRDFHMP